MMVGEDQSSETDKRAGTAVIESDAGETHVLKPRGGGSEVVLLLELLDRRIVEGPHAFVGAAQRGACQKEA